ncbi:MAG: hypothetical protein Q9164_003438 [Protoblastenia rupestris]
MSGRRLLDAAAVLKASRNVAAKHLVLRKHQLDAYSKTSSFAHAVKSQTDRVTLTVKAASALAQRFNDTNSQSPTFAENGEASGVSPSATDQGKSSQKAKTSSGKQGSKKDEFYEQSEASTGTEHASVSGLDVEQERPATHPLPNEAVPPEGNAKSVSPSGSKPTETPLVPTPNHARKLQRQAEKHIPSQAAEPPTAAYSRPRASTVRDSDDPRLTSAQQPDVFYEPSSESGQVLSALPRVKLPKHTEVTQEGDESVSDKQINQDVFYSSVPKDQSQAIPEAQAVPEQQQIPEETYSELFQSSKVASMLRGATKKDAAPGELSLPGAKQTPVKRTKAPQDKDRVSSSLRTPEEGSISKQTGNNDVHELAADISKDASTAFPDPPQVGT